MEMEQILEEYYADDGVKIKKLVNKILFKFGGIYQKDHDDFYSIANEVICNICKTYDDSQSFDGYLYSCLSNKIKTEITRREREKRKADKLSISIDTPIGENENLTICDILSSDFDIEKETDILSDERVEKYLNSLTSTQRKIAEMLKDGYLSYDIMETLQLTKKQYTNALNDMKKFEKSRVLKQSEYVQTEEENSMKESCTQTLEKSKPDRLSISSIIKKIDNYTIRFDHPLQRASGQWSPAMKGNLISDILQGNPIPPLVFAEQIVNGLAIIWDLDGKQRCTNVYSFHIDGYKITKNIRRWNILYQETIRDENGKPILDENGFPQSKKREFDIRGKKFSDLPEELRDRLMDYNFEIVQYLNCSSEDIAYHIARYNEGKPMTASQKGITRLGEEFASMVKSISGMPFFKELGGYKVSEGNNGTVNRVVVESVMAANFLDDWKKKQEDMCEYMKENATSEHFDNFEDMVERISKVGNEEVFNMFNSKDSFIWFGLFTRFASTGLEDGKFIEFMAEFVQSLHSEAIDDVTYDELNGKSTKDKNVVVAKINHLEKLMFDYLRIEKEEATEELIVEDTIIKNYIKEFENIDVIKAAIKSESENIRIAIQTLMMVCEESNLTDKGIQIFLKDSVNKEEYIKEEYIEDTLLYLNGLNDWSLGVDNNSKIFSKENIPALVKFVGHVYKNDTDEDVAIQWFEKFVESFEVNGELPRDINEKYKIMILSLDKYINYLSKKSA